MAASTGSLAINQPHQGAPLLEQLRHAPSAFILLNFLLRSSITCLNGVLIGKDIRVKILSPSPTEGLIGPIVRSSSGPNDLIKPGSIGSSGGIEGINKPGL